MTGQKESGQSSLERTGVCNSSPGDAAFIHVSLMLDSWKLPYFLVVYPTFLRYCYWWFAGARHKNNSHHVDCLFC